MPRIKTIAELRAELATKEKQLGQLKAERLTLAKRMEQIDGEIAALSGDRRRGPRKTARKARGKAPAARRMAAPGNAKPLNACVKEVLATAGEGMRVRDIMVAVTKAGYRSTAKDFYGLVAAALQDKAFQRVDRGVYTLKGQKSAPADKPARKTAKKRRAKKASKKNAAAKGTRRAAKKATKPSAPKAGTKTGQPQA